MLRLSATAKPVRGPERLFGSFRGSWQPPSSEHGPLLSMPHDDALVVVLDVEPLPAIRQVAQEHAWFVLNNPEPTGLACEYKLRRPTVVVIQVAKQILLIRRAARFIRWMRQHGGAIGILAVAGEDDAQLESDMREAGITGYLTSDTPAGDLERAVWTLLSLAGHAPTPAMSVAHESTGPELAPSPHPETPTTSRLSGRRSA